MNQKIFDIRAALISARAGIKNANLNRAHRALSYTEAYLSEAIKALNFHIDELEEIADVGVQPGEFLKGLNSGTDA
jgi:hypothetical protein